MKQKMQYAVQLRQSAPPPPSNKQVQNRQVQEEIQNFLRALDSYPARAAKEPQVSFQQHLSSVFARSDNAVRGQRARRQ
jgi:hypothetical protein